MTRCNIDFGLYILKRCPFCGSLDDYRLEPLEVECAMEDYYDEVHRTGENISFEKWALRTPGTEWIVACKCGGFFVAPGPHHGRKETIDGWNRRAGDDGGR